MKIGIIADSHDNVPSLKSALNLLASMGVKAIIHAGDIIAPFSAKVLAAFNEPVHVVYGNNDGERAGLKNILPQITNGPLSIELGNKVFTVVHDRADVKPDDLSGADYVVFGHTHEVSDEESDGVRWLNPGECGGWLSGKRTVMLFDTETGEAEVREVPE